MKTSGKIVIGWVFEVVNQTLNVKLNGDFDTICQQITAAEHEIRAIWCDFDTQVTAFPLAIQSVLGVVGNKALLDQIQPYLKMFTKLETNADSRLHIPP